MPALRGVSYRESEDGMTMQEGDPESINYVVAYAIILSAVFLSVALILLKKLQG